MINAIKEIWNNDDSRECAMWLLVLCIIVAIILFVVWYEKANCLSGHQTDPYHDDPFYVRSGDLLIPVGGGMESDFICDKWK